MRLKDKIAVVVGAGQGPGEGMGNGRATVLRPESRVPLAASDGMTLAQLEAIAQEAGIEPQ